MEMHVHVLARCWLLLALLIASSCFPGKILVRTCKRLSSVSYEWCLLDGDVYCHDWLHHHHSHYCVSRYYYHYHNSFLA